jgi:hypothetical protein
MYCGVWNRCYAVTARLGRFLGSGCVNNSRFLIMQQLDTTIEGLCFLCGSCQDVISKCYFNSVQESVKPGLELEAEE